MNKILGGFEYFNVAGDGIIVRKVQSSLSDVSHYKVSMFDNKSYIAYEMNISEFDKFIDALQNLRSNNGSDKMQVV